MNKTILIGRLTADPVLRYTPSGVAVANFTLAIDRPFKQDGEYQTDFINCVTWRKQAENLSTYVKKGHQVAVEGMIQTRSYENNEGKKVYVTEVMAESIQFLESKSKQSGQQQSQPQQPQKNDNPFANDGEPIDINKDDLPF